MPFAIVLQLTRVYGTLMSSLGKVLNTPKVMHMHVGYAYRYGCIFTMPQAVHCLAETCSFLIPVEKMKFYLFNDLIIVHLGDASSEFIFIEYFHASIQVYVCI